MVVSMEKWLATDIARQVIHPVVGIGGGGVSFIPPNKQIFVFKLSVYFQKLFQRQLLSKNGIKKQVFIIHQMV